MGADVMLDDQVIARVAGGQDLTPADIRVPYFGIEADLLGYH